MKRFNVTLTLKVEEIGEQTTEKFADFTHTYSNVPHEGLMNIEGVLMRALKELNDTSKDKSKK